MRNDIKKEILDGFSKAVGILEKSKEKGVNELRALSDHAIEDVALYKDVDLIAVTVLFYSMYKISHCFNEEDIKDLIIEMNFAIKNLQNNNFGRYNKNIKNLYEVVKRCHAKVKEHLQDVMEAAKIKKGTSLLQKGLSIGRAAGMMGLSNWDLQAYAGRTTAFSYEHEAMPAKKRMENALKIFGVK